MKRQTWFTTRVYMAVVATLFPLLLIAVASLPFAQHPTTLTTSDVPLSNPLAHLSSLQTTVSETGTPANLELLSQANSKVYLPLIFKWSGRLPGGTVISASNGGSVISPDKAVAITFRPNGLPETIIARIQEEDKALLPSNFAWMGPKVEVQALWLDDYQSVNALDPEAQPIPNPGGKPIPPQSRYWATVSIRLQPGQEVDDMLAIARLTHDGGRWQILPTHIDPQLGVAVAETERLGVFALVENATFWFGNYAQAPNALCIIGGIKDFCDVDELDRSKFQHTPAGDGGIWADVPCGSGSCYQDHAFWTWNRSDIEDPDLSIPWDGGIWTPNLPLAGYYTVKAFIPASMMTATVSARYQVYHALGRSFAFVNQNDSAGVWQPLGVYSFTVGSGHVDLDDVVPETNRYGAQIAFDVVRFTYEGQTPPPTLDVISPTIHSITRWLSNGRTNIRAHVTDNVKVSQVELIFNGVRRTMRPRPVGGDIYEITVDVPIAQESRFQIMAVDTSGNWTVSPLNAHLKVRGYLPRTLGLYNLKSGHMTDSCNPGCLGASTDPVVTFNGNFVDLFTDLTVTGLGDTDILIERVYNGLPNEPQGVISYTADAAGNVTETPFYVHPDPFGPGWTFSLGPSLLVLDNELLQGVQVRYPDGHSIDFASTGGGFVPMQTRVYDTLTADDSGYRLKQKDLTEYRFDSTGRLTQITDRNGNTITLTYTGNKLTRADNSAGRWIRFEYNNPEGLISDVYTPEDIHLQYQYVNGLLTKFIDARQKPWTYTYDNGRLSSIITPKGHPSLHLIYDELGRVKEQTVGATERYRFGYDDAAQTTTITDTYGNATVHVYDEQHRLIESRDTHNQSEFYDYDNNDHRTFFQDRQGRPWHYTLDERGNRLTEDGPLGWYREWAYNNLDLPIAMTETISVSPSVIRAFTFEYDIKGNLKKMCNPIPVGNPDCAEFIYDGRGLPTNIKDFANNHTGNIFDPITGDLVSTTNAVTATTHFGYDDLGRVITMQLPLGVGPTYIYTFAYDGNSNLLDMNGPLSYHLGYHYDPNGNLEIAIDPIGGQSRFGYDASENLITSTNQLTFTTIYTYNLMNKLTNFQDPAERVWNYDLDNLFRVTGIHGPEDTHSYIGYDAVSNVISTTDAETRTTFIEFDDLNRPLTVTLNAKPSEPESADVNVTTLYDYDLMGNVLRTVDALNNATEYQYDLLDRLIFMRDAVGQEWRYQHDPMGNLTALINPLPITTTLEYDGVYRPISQTENYLPGGPVDTHTNVTTRNEYDLNGNLLNAIDPLGVVTHFTYNELDQLAQQIRNYRPGFLETAEINVTTEYTFDLASNLRFVTDPRDFVAEFQYDAAFRLIDSFDYERAHTHFDYDRVNNVLAVIDGNQHPTTYAYDDLDRVISATNAETHTVSFGYDKVSNLIGVVDAKKIPTRIDVDALNRPVTVTANYRPDLAPASDVNVVTAYRYDRMSNVLTMTDPNGHPTSYTYDNIYRTRFITDAESNTSEFIWGLNNNLSQFIDGNGHPTVFGYDELDRQISVTNAETETTQYAYNPLGYQTQLIEADNTVTFYDYDPLYRLNLVIENYRLGEPENNDTNVATHYRYDPSSNFAQFIDANHHITTFEHDGMGRVLTETNPLTNIWAYTYDGVGNTRTRRDANGYLTEYAYYPDNQLRRIDYQQDGTSVEYTYDPNNNRTSMHDHLGLTTWAYDALNRMTHTVDPFGRALHSGYDPAGNRLSLMYPDGNRARYSYLDNNWLKSLEAPNGYVTSYERDHVGNVLHITNPNDTVTDITYDRVNRTDTLTTRQTVGAQAIINAFDYAYNPVGHVTEVVNTYGWRQPDVVTEQYAYDGLHRLSGMSNSEGVTMGYAYDKVGNRTEWTTNDDLTTQTPRDGFTAAYQYNAANQLTQADVLADHKVNDEHSTFQYDANGNRINKQWDGPQGTPIQGVDYAYDPENRLISALDYQHEGNKRVDRALTTLEYDGGGRRLAQTYDPKIDPQGDKRTEYVFDGLDPVAEYSMWNGQRENFYRGDMGRIALMHHFPSGIEGQMYWYNYNFKGDVAGLTKQNGQSTHNYRYDPYGGVLPDNGNFTDPHNHYTLTGKEFDENTGLVYFGARHYDATTATWVTQDTYRGTYFEPMSLHRYMYTYNNPSTYVDLDGHFVWKPIMFAIDWGWNIVEMAWNIYTINIDPNATAIDKQVAQENLGLIWTTELAEPDELTLVNLPADDLARWSFRTARKESLEKVAKETLERIQKEAIERAEKEIAEKALKGSIDIARKAASKGDNILPGLFKFGECPTIPGYDRHHLWPKAFGGPADEGWIAFVKSTEHATKEGIQGRLNDYVMKKLNWTQGQRKLEEFAKANPDQILPVLRDFYKQEGIPFPY